MVVRPAIHSSPQVCVSVCVLLITPYHKSNHFSVAHGVKNWLAEARTQTRESPPASSGPGHATVPLKNSASSSSEISALPLILSHKTHSFSLIPFGQHTPLEKSPNHSLLQHKYTSLLPTACFYKVKHSQEEGKKHLVVISLLFFHSTFPLRSIPLARAKTNSGR